MVFREENILFSTLKELLKKQEWSAIKSQENEIGFYGGVEPGEEWEKTDEYIYPNQLEKGVGEEKFKKLPEDLKDILGQEVPQKIEFGEKSEKDIEFDTGYLNEKELNLIFKNLPVDLTFIDKNDRVRFFSDKNRIFLRSRLIIGRPVKYCHPPSSVEVVEKILKEFKEGDRDEADFWIQMSEDFVYISYHAIFDDDDEYVGALEVTQEISKLRDLEGQQTLLDWK
ncbi:hypothetical protein C9439_00215 [archaeon SCG-AAA382B04]|nr:hypothetical protein C9439_00215 [archaeon SCG-AAA382B04]